MALLSVFNQLIRRDLQRCGVQSKTVMINGAQVHYYDAPGKADLPPTLLVHGFGDSANTWYQTLVPIARALGRVVALDYPGVGFSRLPPGKDFETLPELIETVEQFAREVLGGPALLVGHSLGGAMSLRMAARQGARKKEAPLWTGVLAISPAGAQMSQDQLDELRRTFHLPDRASARALLARLFTSAPWPLWLVENDIRALFRSPAVHKLLESIDPDDFLTPKELGQITVPCLILWGNDERLLPASLVDYYRLNLPPHGVLEVIRGWPHASQMEKPEEVAERITRFGEAIFEARPGAATPDLGPRS